MLCALKNEVVYITIVSILIQMKWWAILHLNIYWGPFQSSLLTESDWIGKMFLTILWFSHLTGILWWEDSCLCCCGRNLLLWFFCCHFLAKKEVRVDLKLNPLWLICSNSLVEHKFRVCHDCHDFSSYIVVCIKITALLTVHLFYYRGKMPGLTFSNELISRDEV